LIRKIYTQIQPPHGLFIGKGYGCYGHWDKERGFLDCTQEIDLSQESSIQNRQYAEFIKGGKR